MNGYNICIVVVNILMFTWLVVILASYKGTNREAHRIAGTTTILLYALFLFIEAFVALLCYCTERPGYQLCSIVGFAIFWVILLTKTSAILAPYPDHKKWIGWVLRFGRVVKFCDGEFMGSPRPKGIFWLRYEGGYHEAHVNASHKGFSISGLLITMATPRILQANFEMTSEGVESNLNCLLKSMIEAKDRPTREEVEAGIKAFIDFYTELKIEVQQVRCDGHLWTAEKIAQTVSSKAT